MADLLCSGYNIPTQYRKISAGEFQQLLESRDGMSAELALDFAEQLMMFEDYGNVYAEDFIQAAEVCGLAYVMSKRYGQTNRMDRSGACRSGLGMTFSARTSYRRRGLSYRMLIFIDC